MEILTGIVTGSRTGTNREGTAAGRLLQVLLSGDEDVQTVEMVQQGEEHHPVPGSRVIVVQGGSAYKLAVRVDDGVDPVMQPGGKRHYATDATGGAVTAEIRLLPSGEVQVFNGEVALTLEPSGAATVENDAASFTMGADGAFVFHGVSSHFDHPVTMAETLTVTGDAEIGGALDVTGTIDASDAISSTVSVTAPTVAGTTDVLFASKSTLTHDHLSDGPGANTGPPN